MRKTRGKALEKRQGRTKNEKGGSSGRIFLTEDASSVRGFRFFILRPSTLDFFGVPFKSVHGETAVFL